MNDEPQCPKCGGRGRPDCDGCFGCGLDLSQHPIFAVAIDRLTAARARIEQLERVAEKAHYNLSCAANMCIDADVCAEIDRTRKLLRTALAQPPAVPGTQCRLDREHKSSAEPGGEPEPDCAVTPGLRARDEHGSTSPPGNADYDRMTASERAARETAERELAAYKDLGPADAIVQGVISRNHDLEERLAAAERRAEEAEARVASVEAAAERVVCLARAQAFKDVLQQMDRSPVSQAPGLREWVDRQRSLAEGRAEDGTP